MAYARAMPLPAQLKKLLQDCDVETFRGTEAQQDDVTLVVVKIA